MNNLGWPDKYPRANCIVSIMLGIVLGICSVTTYDDIRALEEMGGEITRSRSHWLVYGIIGTFGTGAFLCWEVRIFSFALIESIENYRVSVLKIKSTI